MADKTLYLIIPVFNEEGNIPHLISSISHLKSEVKEYNLKVVFVDDGSKDNTIETLNAHKKDLDVTVLNYGSNKGPGYAFGEGFSYLKDKLGNDDIVITMEGDNTSKTEIILFMLNRIKVEQVDVVLASPYAYGGGIHNTSIFREVISFLANILVRIALGIQGIHTFSSFFRAYKASVILQLQEKYGSRIVSFVGFECMVELLKKMVDLKITISEIAMPLDTSMRVGKSKMKIWKTIKGYIRLIIKINT